MAGEFENWRDNYSRSEDGSGFVEWARQRMTRGIRAVEENAQQIADAGQAAVRSQIEAFDRIADPHDPKDGPQSMIEGVQTSINKSRTEGEMSVRVGWDLTEYRDGYPELQDKGFTPTGGASRVVGMQALSYGRMVMREEVDRIVKNAKD